MHRRVGLYCAGTVKNFMEYNPRNKPISIIEFVLVSLIYTIAFSSAVCDRLNNTCKDVWRCFYCNEKMFLRRWQIYNEPLENIIIYSCTIYYYYCYLFIYRTSVFSLSLFIYIFCYFLSVHFGRFARCFFFVLLTLSLSPSVTLLQ